MIYEKIKIIQSKLYSFNKEVYSKDIKIATIEQLFYNYGHQYDGTEKYFRILSIPHLPNIDNLEFQSFKDAINKIKNEILSINRKFKIDNILKDLDEEKKT